MAQQLLNAWAKINESGSAAQTNPATGHKFDVRGGESNAPPQLQAANIATRDARIQLIAQRDEETMQWKQQNADMRRRPREHLTY